MISFARLRGLVAFLAVLQLLGQARAGVAPLDPSVHVDVDKRQTNFSLNFDHPPDLNDMDAMGRQIDGFEVEISGLAKSAHASINEFASVTRHDKSHVNGPPPIGVGSPLAADAHARGWEAVIGSAPLSVSSDVVTFSAPLTRLGPDDGRFAHEAFVTRDGQVISDAQTQIVPLPVILPIAAMILLIVVLIRWAAAQHMHVAVRWVRVVRR